jgi:hypothetical protein
MRFKGYKVDQSTVFSNRRTQSSSIDVCQRKRSLGHRQVLSERR